MATIVSAKLINPSSIENALVNAFEKWAKEDINEEHWDNQFKNERWDYGNETRRKNGSTVGSPRDIYDLGALYDSGVESFKLSKDVNLISADWHWNALNSSGQEYAWYVHEGKGSNVDRRPFTDDIAVESSFYFKAPGLAFESRVAKELMALRAN